MELKIFISSFISSYISNFIFKHLLFEKSSLVQHYSYTISRNTLLLLYTTQREMAYIFMEFEI